MNLRIPALLLIALFATRASAKEDPAKPYAGSAAEPDVINPVAMSFDEKGRLWILEAYEYPYERPPFTKKSRPGRDRVICLEAPNGEERATKRTVVATDLWLASAITFGNGGIYVGQAPDLYFYPITD